MAWAVLVGLARPVILVPRPLLRGAPALLVVLLFQFLPRSPLPTTELLVVVEAAVVAVDLVPLGPLEAGVAAASVLLPPTLRLALLALTTVVPPVAQGALELIPPLVAVVLAHTTLFTAHALAHLFGAGVMAALVAQEARQDHQAHLVLILDPEAVAPGAAQSQEIQTSLGWLQEQDSGASHEHHLFF